MSEEKQENVGKKTLLEKVLITHKSKKKKPYKELTPTVLYQALKQAKEAEKK